MKEFREFALKGNVVDLAIGVIIGGAFGTIVSSLVSDMIMPLIGALGGIDRTFIDLRSAVRAEAGNDPQRRCSRTRRREGAVLACGKFVTAVINFLIIAFVLFLTVAGINRLRRQPPPPTPFRPRRRRRTSSCLTEIRDLLAKR